MGSVGPRSPYEMSGSFRMALSLLYCLMVQGEGCRAEVRGKKGRNRVCMAVMADGGMGC